MGRFILIQLKIATEKFSVCESETRRIPESVDEWKFSRENSLSISSIVNANIILQYCDIIIRHAE